MRRAAAVRAIAFCAILPLIVLASPSCARPSDGGPGVKAGYSKTTGKLELITHDTNKDGKLDAWCRMDGTRLVSMEIDRNFDGTIDRWEYYSVDGDLEKVGFSLANDGKADAWAYQGPDGQVTRIEVSTGRDGKANRLESYEGGKLVRSEEDANGDGKPDKWETYRDGALASVEIDIDHDGQPDRRLAYGANGVKAERLR